MNLDFAAITRGKTKNRNDDFVTAHAFSSRVILGILGDFTGDSQQGTNNLFRERIDTFIKQQRQTWLNNAAKPDEILKSIFSAGNQWLKKNQSRKAQTTLVLFLVDARQGIMHYMVAGDSGLAVLRSDKLEFLIRGETTGAKDASDHLPGSMRQVYMTRLKPQDRVVAYSDGLWDTTQGLHHAEEHLVAAMGGGNRGMVERNLHLHLVDVATFEDDLTLLVVFPINGKPTSKQAIEIASADLADDQKAQAAKQGMNAKAPTGPRTPVQQVLVELFQEREGQFNKAVAQAVMEMRPGLEQVVKDELRQKAGNSKPAQSHQQNVKKPLQPSVPDTGAKLTIDFADRKVQAGLGLVLLLIIAYFTWPMIQSKLKSKPYTPQAYTAPAKLTQIGQDQQLAYLFGQSPKTSLAKQEEIQQVLAADAIPVDKEWAAIDLKNRKVQLRITQSLELTQAQQAFLLWLQLASGNNKAELPIPQRFASSFEKKHQPEMDKLNEMVKALTGTDPTAWDKAILETFPKIKEAELKKQLKDLLATLSAEAWAADMVKEAKAFPDALPKYRELRVVWLSNHLKIPHHKGELASIDLFRSTDAANLYQSLVPATAIQVKQAAPPKKETAKPKVNEPKPKSTEPPKETKTTQGGNR